MSTSSYIQITVDNEASRFLRDEFGAVKFRQTLRRGMERGMLKVHGQIPEYPPPRAMTQVGRSSKLWSKGARKVSGHATKGRWWASSHRRTGTLGRSITTRVEDAGDGVKGVIGTNVSVKTESSGYAQYVIGDPQAWMHQGRWWQLVKEVEKHSDDVVNAINEELDAAINRG